MWELGWRERIWGDIDHPWDIIIVGGGITGAGLLRLAAKTGLRALLLEAKDFSSGTSSRSSKLVHGGFRYLYNRQFDVTRESVREREWLMREARHLVTPLPFILPNYKRYRYRNQLFAAGVMMYDLLAPKWQHERVSERRAVVWCPGLCVDGMKAAWRYYDGVVDDSRLVLRVIREAVRSGGTAISYARVSGLLRTADGRVRGVRVSDTSSPHGREMELEAAVVINATGPWSDELRETLGGQERLRRLRGSHLVFPHERLPIQSAVTFFHPADRRAMFIIPWDGTTMVGTTDLDHPRHLELDFEETFASQGEVDYMLEGINTVFPDAKLTLDDAAASFAGLRPVIRGDASSPSKESRRHAIWEEDGMITITGGKLTTFRIMAEQAIKAALKLLPGDTDLTDRRMFDPLPKRQPRLIPLLKWQYLVGRYGEDTPALLSAARDGELESIAGLLNVWAELRWAARDEAVVHLDDLMLRRVRLGLCLPVGGIHLLAQIRAIVQPELGWDDVRWSLEVERYQKIWRMYYAPIPEANLIGTTKEQVTSDR
jgi:glycerol-3-phosphate dehydrogenase